MRKIYMVAIILFIVGCGNGTPIATSSTDEVTGEDNGLELFLQNQEQYEVAEDQGSDLADVAQEHNQTAQVETLEHNITKVEEVIHTQDSVVEQNSTTIDNPTADDSVVFIEHNTPTVVVDTMENDLNVTTVTTNDVVLQEDNNTIDEPNIVTVEEEVETEDLNVSSAADDNNTIVKETNTTTIEDTNSTKLRVRHLQITEQYHWNTFNFVKRFEEMMQRDRNILTDGLKERNFRKLSSSEVRAKIRIFRDTHSFRWVSDMDNYQVRDYYTILQEGNNFTGDCEDWAFTFMNYLLSIGADPKDLYYTIGIWEKQVHAWLEIDTTEGRTLINYYTITQGEEQYKVASETFKTMVVVKYVE